MLIPLEQTDCHKDVGMLAGALALLLLVPGQSASPFAHAVASEPTVTVARSRQPSAPEIPTLPGVTVEGNAVAANNDQPLTANPNLTGDIASGATGPFQIRRGDNLLGDTLSASQGVFGQADLQDRPLLRPGSALELIPGVVATQHSGSGKANQYFLRGFNLDHGTDFNVKVDGVPINLPTNGHGQGYLDVNWLIPELIDYVEYKKGPYYAEVGDFSSAGAAEFHYVRSLPRSLALATAGSYDYYRALFATSQQVGSGDLLFAYESVFNNGPWDVPEGFNKFNGMLRYTIGDEDHGLSLSALAYRSYWTPTNHISERAVDAGIIGRFGSLDPTDHGQTDRVTLNGEYWNIGDTTITKANAYVAYYDLDMFSNFTYFLDDPVNGDQIQQLDQRYYTGLNLSQQWLNDYGSNTVGFQFRNDSIGQVGLNRTSQRRLISRVSDDRVNQQQYSLYATNETRWTDWFRSVVGMRGDWYRFEAEDQLDPADSGAESAAICSPKTGLVFGPWAETELFVNWGLGFHSNDARGVTTQVDPANPLVRSNGSEIGIRSQVLPGWQTTLTGWYLELDSELVFVGDAGTTEPAGASHRSGIEFTNFFQINDWTTFDVDYAWVRPRLEGGERIPNAVENVLSTGITIRNPDGGWFSTVRLQSYGPAALIEDNSARSGVTSIVNLEVGYQGEDWRLAVDVFNLLNAKAYDITYFYESNPAHLGPAESYHFHPVQPVSARVTLTRSF